MKMNEINRIIAMLLLLLVEKISSAPLAPFSTIESEISTATPSPNIDHPVPPLNSKNPPTCNSQQNVIIHGASTSYNSIAPGTKRRDDYQYTPGMGAHKFHSRGANFNNARKICRQEGGHLVVIDSDAEERILLDLFARAGSLKNVDNGKQAYIGLHNLFADDDWVTIFNDPLHTRGYTKWSDDDGYGGQPDNLGGNQHCGTLWKPGVATGMDDVDCHLKYAFFCEIPEIEIVI